jgi:hypothetical protein
MGKFWCLQPIQGPMSTLPNTLSWINGQCRLELTRGESREYCSGVAGLVLEYLDPDGGWLTTAAAAAVREQRHRPRRLVLQVRAPLNQLRGGKSAAGRARAGAPRSHSPPAHTASAAGMGGGSVAGDEIARDSIKARRREEERAVQGTSGGRCRDKRRQVQGTGERLNVQCGAGWIFWGVGGGGSSLDVPDENGFDDGGRWRACSAGCRLCIGVASFTATSAPPTSWSDTMPFSQSSGLTPPPPCAPAPPQN